MTELEKNHIDQHKTLIAKLESVDVSMYQDGYELGYTGGVATAEARIAKLEAKLRTMSELDEQYLLIIDEQSERIAELERMLFDAGAVIEEYSGLIDEKGEKVAELFNQTVSQARVIAELKSAQRYSEVSGKAQP